MSRNSPKISPDVHYDDGIVCFGPVTENELERHKKLPRYTAVPSDIILSHSYFDSDNDECVKNDQSIQNHLNESKTNTTLIDDSINTTQSTIDLDKEEKEISSIKLKQCSSKDSILFASPCTSRFVHSVKLMETEVINRYIRMESMSSDESFIEDQNKSTSNEGGNKSFVDIKETDLTPENSVCENVGFVKVQVELIHDNSVVNETDSCDQLFDSSVIEQNMNNENKNNVNNVCILKHCNQEEKDVSITSDIEMEEAIEDCSIVADKYSITPGKQRLFDLRHTKPSFCAKSHLSSAPFMDRIEETITPVISKNLNSPVSNNLSCKLSETKENLDLSLANSMNCSSSSVNFNQTSNVVKLECIGETDKVLDSSLVELNTVEEMTSTNYINYTIYKSDVKDVIDTVEKSIVIDSEVEPAIVGIEENMYENELSNESASDFNVAEKSEALDIEITMSNTDVEDSVSDVIMRTSFFINNKSLVNNKLFNETDKTENITNITENQFDLEKSVNNTMPNINISTIDDCDYSIKKFEAMEVEIESSNTNVVDIKSNISMCNNTFFIDNKSMNIDESLNITNKAENTSNIVKDKFNLEHSINSVSNINISTTGDSVNINLDKPAAMKLEVESANINVVDTKSNVSTCNNTFFIDNKSMNIDESLNITNEAENTSKIIENQFDLEKSMNTVSNINISTIDNYDYNQEKSEAMEGEIESENINVVDTESNVSTCNNTFFINNRSMCINESLNKTNKARNISNVAENQFDLEKSVNTEPNINISTIGNSIDNNEDTFETIKLEFESTNTNEIDIKSNVSMCNNTFSIDNKSMNIDKLLNITNEAENVSNIAEDKFNLEKSMNSVSNINISTISDSIDNNDGKSEAIVAEVKSATINVKDIKCNISICSDILSKRNSSVNENEILNITETSCPDKHTFDLVFSGNMSESIVPTAIIDKEPSQNSELCNNILEYSTNQDIFCSKKNENSFSNKVSETSNTNLVYSSNAVKQYLNFDQTQIETCGGILLDSNSEINESINYCNQSQENISMIDQTICSETINDIIKVKDSYSILNSPTKSNLSVIIENRTLEEEIMIQNKITESTVDDISSLSIPKNTTNKDGSKVEIEPIMSDINTIEINIKSNENNIDETIIGSELSLNENQNTMDNVTLNSNISMASNKLSINKTNTEMDGQLNNKTIERLLSENIPDNQNDLIGFSMYNSNEVIEKPEKSFHNFIDQESVLNKTDGVNSSLAEFTKLEQMIIEEDKKTHMFKTPKTEKLLDFSIVQQTPTFNSQAKKQKLFNFSIVEQSPMSKSIQQVSFDHELTKKDALIDFSSFGQIWDLDLSSTNKINFNKDFQNSTKMSTSNNLSTISAPDVDLLADESIETNSSFNQTMTDANLNRSAHCEINKTQNNTNDTNNVQSSINNDSMMLTNTQIEVDKSSNFMNTTFELNKSYDKRSNEETENQPECSTGIISNQNFKTAVSNEQLLLDSHKHNIVDFSIIEQSSELKNIGNITCAEFDNNVTNLIEMSVVSMSGSLSSNKQLISSDNPVLVVTTCNTSEKSLPSYNSDIDKTEIHFENSQLSHNTEYLTDVQMNDVSLLMESSEKSSISESFHSIENDYRVQEDNKRKLEPAQEYHRDEKKMKVITEEPRTPISMLYKIKNMFRSSEKSLHCANSTKENVLRPNEHRQKLNFSKCEENNENLFKPLSYKKSELPVKSKIPCKVLTNRSMTKNDEFDSSISSLNDITIKSKKTIPKYSGLPVLSDVSNSSARKLPESRIPSKFQK